MNTIPAQELKRRGIAAVTAQPFAVDQMGAGPVDGQRAAFEVGDGRSTQRCLRCR